MKLVGIIVEYNPFHNGHIYHIQETRKMFPDSIIVAIMSGDVCQRGSFAIASKKRRARIGIKYGIDVVVELPLFKVLQAAHLFAFYAVEILHRLGVSNIVFGSESNNICKLKKIARAQIDQKPAINKNIKQFLKSGLSYPKSYNEALKIAINESVEDANDMLGIQYIKTIFEENYQIEPVAIKRTIPFHSNDAQDQFASATLIRKMLLARESTNQFTPLKKFKNIKNQNARIFKKLIKIFKKCDLKTIKQYHLVSEGIENLIFKQLKVSLNYEELVENCVSRRYTRSRIQRTLMSIYYQIQCDNKSLLIKNKAVKKVIKINVLAINKKIDIEIKRNLHAIIINNYES